MASKSLKYIFDVDGTLTPSRATIDWEFEKWFLNFCKKNQVYLVTGSDRDKTIEQIGENVYNSCVKVYQCSGNDVWVKDQNIRSKIWDMPEDVKADLSEELNSSKFYRKTGHHFDTRPGLVNFSVVGRKCNLEDRAMYKQWDEHKSERVNIAKRMSVKYPSIQFEIAGETGIDITPKGCDKSQILDDFKLEKIDQLHFFGDACDPGGNDHKLYRAIYESFGKVYHVKDWIQTWNLLKTL